jgi:hypothetical protein
MPQPRLDIAKAFLGRLSPNGTLLRLALFYDGAGPKRVREIEATPATFAGAVWPQEIVPKQAAGFGVFYFLNRVAPGASTTNPKGWPYATDRDVTGIRALAVDCDNGLLPDDAWHVPPDLIVTTSPLPDGRCKGQALWLVRDCAPAQFTPSQQRLIAHYNKGVADDMPPVVDRAVTDRKRLLRLPGTLHQKRAPFLVTFCDFYTGGTRWLDDIVGMLPPAPSKRKPVQAKQYNIEAARHPFNVDQARRAFDRIVEEYRGGIPEGDRHRAMFRIAWQPFSFTDDVELVTQWCCEEAFELLEPGRYETGDFAREVEHAFNKRQADGTLANRAVPLGLLEPPRIDFGGSHA